MLKTGNFNIRVVPRFFSSFQPLTAFAFQMISNAKPYVFPILTSTDTKEAYEEYQISINNHNRQLRRLSKMLPAGCKLTSYTSRHSWATAARNHNVPISVISAGMGHTSEQTTRIYLTMLGNSVIDEANKGIISGLW